MASSFSTQLLQSHLQVTHSLKLSVLMFAYLGFWVLNVFSFLFQVGNFSQDALSMVQRSHTVSRIGYNKSLSLRSHVALRFSTTQQSGPRSIGYCSKVTCAAAASENVSFYDMGDNNNILSIFITINTINK